MRRLAAWSLLAAASGVAAQVSAQEPARPVEPPSIEPFEQDPLDISDVPLESKRNPRVYVGPALGVSSGYAPAALVTLGATLGVRSTRASWLSPLVQLHGQWGQTGITGPATETATYVWALLRLDACPSQLEVAPGLAFVPCLSGEVGSASASERNEGIALPSSAALPWGALGPSLALRMTGASWFGSFGASALATFTRERFGFSTPTTPNFEVSAVVFSGLLAVGVEL